MTRPSQTSGFTLSELLIATTIGSFAMAGILTAFLSLQRSYAATSDSIMETSRFVVVQDQLGVDLRSALAVTTAQPQQLGLRVRYYSDSEAEDHVVTFRFDRGTGELTREREGNRYVLMAQLRDATFTYYRRSSSGQTEETSAAAEVNAVRISVTPDQDRVGGLQRRQSVFASSLFQLRRIAFP
ncbi:PilW family protein [Synoicihabitans lomoniglobus]|uniref:Prepilin-type N-terminal cleavage/methylation domain-containing protein n=1 Tax=Synoicihabitans lomoniglobus TaxID=2909285 RepID=A0AAE9ZY09_9BACT|nr:prepilin-type N-terminal cleavage/methylation domain-containing protein [Opitutaceae bacterium LMO-M01]WED64658.1 prepilin-type N-terminal cleavage/methylation domain-containing protein [Opitutaceae bacterium LMO-M01]